MKFYIINKNKRLKIESGAFYFLSIKYIIKKIDNKKYED